MRLRTRFAMALVLLALVLSATSLAGFVLYRDAVISHERAELGQASESVAAQIDTVLVEKQRQVRLWVQAPSLTKHGSISQEARLGAFVRTTDFSGASVIAANGTMMALSSEGLSGDEQTQVVGQHFGDRTYFQRAMAGQTYVSDPIQAETGNLIVTVSSPLYEDGEVVATFNGAFHLDEGDLSSIIRTNSGPSDGVQIVANGTTVHSVGPVGDDGSEVLSASARVDATGWIVSTTTTKAEFESSLWAVTLAQFGAFGLVLVSLAGFGAWLYREFVGNIERLHEGVGSLVAGDYGSTVSLAGATEWTELEGQFNELSETLAQRRTEVVVLNRVLRHNLRNAMTVVVGNADRIAERTDHERTATEAERIRSRGESLLDLADHARAIESSLGARPEKTSIRAVDDLVDDVVATLTEEFPQADLQVDVEPDSVAVPNGEVVLVVLDELARNAINHSHHATPTVRLFASTGDDVVRFEVADDGPGMPEVERQVLTERFVETPTNHGAGLGLWLVNWLVHWAHGTVSVAVDDGTTVTVTVPTVPADEPVDR